MPFFERAGLRLHYVEAGQGPPVLLIHGWGGRARRQWHNTIMQLQSQYHLYALELRGHGRSQEVADPEYGWVDLAEDCDALREIAGCERWTVVGYSFGGLVALQYASLFPERVRAVCAVSPMTLPPSWGFCMRYLRAPVAWFLRIARTLPPAVSGRMLHNVAKTRLRTLFHTVAMMHEGEPRSSQVPPTVPAVVLIGDHDRAAHADRVRAVAPGVEVRILEHTGHFPLWKQRERFVRELREVVATPCSRLEHVRAQYDGWVIRVACRRRLDDMQVARRIHDDGVSGRAVQLICAAQIAFFHRKLHQRAVGVDGIGRAPLEHDELTAVRFTAFDIVAITNP